MRPLALLVCLLISSIAWAADPAAEPDDDTEAKKILGTWELVKAEMDGKSPPPDRAKEMKIEITKDQFIITTVGVVGKSAVKYKLHPNSKPRGYDLSLTREKTIKGIYKIEMGELTMCFSEDPGTGRPTKFDEKGRILMVLRKAKAVK